MNRTKPAAKATARTTARKAPAAKATPAQGQYQLTSVTLSIT